MIWYKDFNNFLDTNTVLDVVPTEKMTFTEKLNALFRFSIYASIILYAISNNSKSFLLMIIFGGITYALYVTETKEHLELNDKIDNNLEENKKSLKSLKKECTVPTKNNPFMNVLINEYEENPTRKKACFINKQVGEYVDKYFNEDLYRSVDDIYQKNASERQYYTMPSTEIPNEQDKFAKWLYGIDGKTCKEGNALKCKYFS